MNRPFIYFTIPILFGIVFYYFIEINIFITLILLVLFLIVNLIRLKLNLTIKINLFISFFLLGILLTGLKSNSSQLIEYVDMPIELKGVVKDVKTISEEEGRYIILVHSINHNGTYKNISEKTILKVIGEKQLTLGDEVGFKAILKEPLPNTNPKLFNYKLSLLTENIYTTATIKDYSITTVEKVKPSLPFRLKEGFTNKVERTFDSYLVEDNSSLMKAIVLGNDSYLDGENINQFRDLGLAHILAVSGLHIGILAGFLVSLMAYLGINRKINIGLTIAIIWFYAYIIGGPPSVLRANIMFSLLLLSELLREPYDSINTLFFALFLMIIINPFWIFGIGFQLSFIATFFIIYLTPKISEIFYPYDSKIIKSLAGILSVQFGLLPIQAYYFNRIPLIAVVANLILVPLFSICLILSMVMILFSCFSRLAASSIGLIVNFLLNIQFYGIELFNYFPYLTLRLSSPSIMEIFIYYIFIFILFDVLKIRNLNKRVTKAIIFYLLFLIIINSFAISLNQRLDANFIDVGQGDSILLNTKEGNYLIDTGGNIFGNFDIGENILIPYLEKMGIFKIKGVFITHYDADHCKSLPYLMDNMEVENIYLGYEREGNELYEKIKGKALSKNVPISILRKGDKLRLDNNTNVIVVGPDEELLRNSKNNENNLSLVLLLNYYDKNILFTGDIEKAGEQSLLKSLNANVDFLKVPHHGSKTSSSIELLESTKPKVGFISVGRNNSFGHPHIEVINRYEDNSIDLYRTDQLGLINLNLDRTNYKITPFIKERLSIIYVMKYYGLIISCFIVYIIISYIMIKYFALLMKEMEKVELQGIY